MCTKAAEQKHKFNTNNMTPARGNFRHRHFYSPKWICGICEINISFCRTQRCFQTSAFRGRWDLRPSGQPWEQLIPAEPGLELTQMRTLHCNQALEVIWPRHYLLRWFSAASGRLRHPPRKATHLCLFLFSFSHIVFLFRPILLNITFSRVRCALKNRGSVWFLPRFRWHL